MLVSHSQHSRSINCTEACTDHAVTASTIYLVRSMGSVYGVAITSTILQTVLSIQLPDALGEIQDKGRVRPFLAVLRCYAVYFSSR